MHETRSASESEVLAFVDTVCDRLLGKSQPYEFAKLIGAIDHMKSIVSEALRAQTHGTDHVYDSAEHIVAMLRVADPSLAEHLDATGILAARIAVRMGLPPERAAFIGLCGRLHDIGKLAVPRDLLNKAGTLTAEEFEIIKRHVPAGEEMLRSMAGLEECAPVVRSHHEAWDGKGYPDGLQGEEIPLEARIVAVADVFHALTSDRAYRPAFTPLQAIEMLECGAGKTWDPQIVRAAVQVLGAARSSNVA